MVVRLRVESVLDELPPPPQPARRMARPTATRDTASNCLLRTDISNLPKKKLHLAVSDRRLNLPKQVGGSH
jgi:hypothetical protein